MTVRSDNIAPPMYIHVSRRAVFDGATLALVDLAPATLFIVTEPTLTVGYLPTALFLDHWYRDDCAPGTQAVAAVLSVVDGDRPVAADAHVLVSLPRIRGGGLEYQVTVVEGDVFPTAGACVLFIQPLAAPATPSDSTRSRLSQRPPSASA